MKLDAATLEPENFDDVFFITNRRPSWRYDKESTIKGACSTANRYRFLMAASALGFP